MERFSETCQVSHIWNSIHLILLLNIYIDAEQFHSIPLTDHECFYIIYKIFPLISYKSFSLLNIYTKFVEKLSYYSFNSQVQLQPYEWLAFPGQLFCMIIYMQMFVYNLLNYIHRYNSYRGWFFLDEIFIGSMGTLRCMNALYYSQVNRAQACRLLNR